MREPLQGKGGMRTLPVGGFESPASTSELLFIREATPLGFAIANQSLLFRHSSLPRWEATNGQGPRYLVPRYASPLRGESEEWPFVALAKKGSFLGLARNFEFA